MDPRALRTRRVLFALLVGIAYFAAGWIGLLYPAVGSTITILWLPSGIAVGALIRLGNLALTPIFAASFLVNLSTGLPMSAAFAIAFGNTLGPYATAALLRRLNFRQSFPNPRDILLLTSSALLGMLLSASSGAAILSAADRLEGVPPLQAWLTWWAADTLGVVLGAPLALRFARLEWANLFRKKAEFAAWGICTIAVCWAVFVLNGSTGTERGPR